MTTWMMMKATGLSPVTTSISMNLASRRSFVRAYLADRKEYEIALRRLIPLFKQANYRGECQFVYAHDILLSHQNTSLPERSIIKERTWKKRAEKAAKLERLIADEWSTFLALKSALDRGIPLK